MEKVKHCENFLDTLYMGVVCWWKLDPVCFMCFSCGDLERGVGQILNATQVMFYFDDLFSQFIIF